MQRRKFNQASSSAIGALILATYSHANALLWGDLAGISNAEASTGLKTDLEKGAEAAVALLGRTEGYLGKPKVRIPLFGYLDDASKSLKMNWKN